MTKKLPISLVVITFNEEKNLARALKAADFCSEMIVVDSGSTDETLEIAKSFGARIFHRDWSGYGDQKNYGTTLASNEWILCIDADEIVSPELKDSIFIQFQHSLSFDAFEINRHSLYGSHLIHHGGWYPQWRLFLYRKGCVEWGGEEPHTIPVFNGKRKARLIGDLLHYTYTDIFQHLQKNMISARASAYAMHRNNRLFRWTDLLLRTPWAFLRSYIFQRGFLDGYYGFVIACNSACYTFAKYAMLRELNHRKEN